MLAIVHDDFVDEGKHIEQFGKAESSVDRLVPINIAVNTQCSYRLDVHLDAHVLMVSYEICRYLMEQLTETAALITQ